MIIERFEQGSDEWKAARVGIHTASQWDSLITPLGKAKKGDAPDTYLNKLISEVLTGEREELPSNLYWMKRGVDMEPEARDTAEAMLGIDFEEIGLAYMDESKQVAASPDGINITIETGLEIKCPSPAIHVGYLREGVCPKKYLHQVQGSMLVTGYKSWYFMSYHPNIKPLIVKVERDEEYIKVLKDTLLTQVKIKLEEIERLGA
jgi:hypothetical protein